MFSFGTIKSSTALGGAILRVRDRELLARMWAAQVMYPVQPRWPYLKRLAKYAMLKALACRPICGLFVRVCRAIGCDYDRMVNRAARGFPGDDFFAQIRRQPSAPVAGHARTPPDDATILADRSDTSPRESPWRQASETPSLAPARRSLLTPIGSSRFSSSSRSNCWNI